jgi:hypothetical protein
MSPICSKGISGTMSLWCATLLLLTRAAAQEAPISLPAEEPLSPNFSLRTGEVSAPVYLARICDLTANQRHDLTLPVQKDTALASFASFDLSGNPTVTVTCPGPVQSAKLLPLSSGIIPAISGNQISFTVSKPGQLTLEVNGDWIRSLHLFINPPEANVPSPTDPQVIYFGPGVHEVKGGMAVPSGKTVYLAPGAIVYGMAAPGSPYGEIFSLRGDNITLRGRGIIDGSLCPRGTLSLVGVYGTNIQVEGVVLRDAGGFNMPIRRCRQVKISNVKVFGWRGNSDGMDICNSHNVEVSDSFLRTFDDLIVLKTDKGQGDESDISVRHCVLWNEFAHALSLGAELREPMANINFSDCDVIHDKGREWLLRIYNCDSASVKDVVFDNIRIGEARHLMSVWIGKAYWSKENERGHVENVTFRNIDSVTPELPDPLASLAGFDAAHAVDGVQFQQVRVGGKPLAPAEVQQNTFVQGVSIQP